ncbi:MAG TPA: MFS transporter [Bacteroidales bacterium]|nr:MFS transporter [Bacteroidales bacterium]HOU96442.1 MFS transporter [Bacteroidales bacterium]HQG36644.1 MFS transporter [Bacteroidales bacterium]HQJ20771.1 MFS transporter [Bacteroidales bacterium]
MNDTGKKVGHYRYKILALVFFATTVNYFDRSIIGVMAPTLQKLFGWTNTDYASIMISFKIAYGIGLLFMGNIIDKLGTKIGYIISILTWSIFGMLHAAIRPAFSLIGFIIARFGLGIGESGNFPAAVKTVAEWFPKKERAFANGIFDASTSVGAILAPFIVGAIVSVDGKNWQIPFLFTGGLSAIWVLLWLKTYHRPQDHPKLSKEELAYINSDSIEETAEKIPWARLLPKRETWAFALTTVTDAVWWFYLFWGAKFLGEQFGVDINNIGIPFLIIFLMADAGSLGGGYASGALIGKGWSVNRARKITMLVCAILILPVSFVPMLASKWIAVFLIGLAAAGHQSWSITGYTLVSDVFPRKAVASVTGIGKMVGVATSIVADYALGTVLDSSGNLGYFWAFIIAGLSYLFILIFVHLLMPKMTPLNDNLEYVTVQNINKITT